MSKYINKKTINIMDSLGGLEIGVEVEIFNSCKCSVDIENSCLEESKSDINALVCSLCKIEVGVIIKHGKLRIAPTTGFNHSRDWSLFSLNSNIYNDKYK